MSFDLERLLDFLDVVARHARRMREQIPADAALSVRRAKLTQALLVEFFVDFIFSEMEQTRFGEIQADNGEEPMWDDFPAAFHPIDCLARSWAGAVNAGEAILVRVARSAIEPPEATMTVPGKTLNALELAYEVLSHCMENLRTLKADWSQIHKVLKEKPGDFRCRTIQQRRDCERRLIQLRARIFRWADTSQFQILSLVQAGTLIEANHEQQLRSRFSRGDEPFDFMKTAAQKTLDADWPSFYESIALAAKRDASR